FFFFSSRRRHTRSKRDWSSDVCSSDPWVSASSVVVVGQDRHEVELALAHGLAEPHAVAGDEEPVVEEVARQRRAGVGGAELDDRSEERRVGRGSGGGGCGVE